MSLRLKILKLAWMPQLKSSNVRLKLRLLLISQQTGCVSQSRLLLKTKINGTLILNRQVRNTSKKVRFFLWTAIQLNGLTLIIVSLIKRRQVILKIIRLLMVAMVVMNSCSQMTLTTLIQSFKQKCLTNCITLWTGDKSSLVIRTRMLTLMVYVLMLWIMLALTCFN